MTQLPLAAYDPGFPAREAVGEIQARPKGCGACTGRRPSAASCPLPNRPEITTS